MYIRIIESHRTALDGNTSSLSSIHSFIRLSARSQTLISSHIHLQLLRIYVFPFPLSLADRIMSLHHLSLFLSLSFSICARRAGRQWARESSPPPRRPNPCAAFNDWLLAFPITPRIDLQCARCCLASSLIYIYVHVCGYLQPARMRGPCYHHYLLRGAAPRIRVYTCAAIIPQQRVDALFRSRLHSSPERRREIRRGKIWPARGCVRASGDGVPHVRCCYIAVCFLSFSCVFEEPRAVFPGTEECRVSRMQDWYTRTGWGQGARFYEREREQPAGVIGFRWRRMRLFGNRRTGCSCCCRTGRFVNCRGALCDAAFGFK